MLPPGVPPPGATGLTLAVKVTFEPGRAGFDEELSASVVFAGRTVMVKVSLAPKGGEPSSVTRTVTALVLGDCAGAGVQVTTPVSGLIVMPAGADRRLKTSVLAGISASVAVLVRESVGAP